jgi:hypothetical protein
MVRDARLCRAPHHEGRRAHPEEPPTGPREARPDDRLRGVSKDEARAASGHGPIRGKFVIRVSGSICDDHPESHHERRSWRCNSGRTANIATRTCRRALRTRGSAPTNARSARTASTASCTMSEGNCLVTQTPARRLRHQAVALGQARAPEIQRRRCCRAFGAVEGYSAAGAVNSPPSLRAKRRNPSFGARERWIASSLALLAMTGRERHPAAKIVPSTSPNPTR